MSDVAGIVYGRAKSQHVSPTNFFRIGWRLRPTRRRRRMVIGVATLAILAMAKLSDAKFSLFGCDNRDIIVDVPLIGRIGVKET